MCEDLEEGACDKLAPLQKRHAEIIRRDWPKRHARDEATTKTKTRPSQSHSTFCATGTGVHCLGRRRTCLTLLPLPVRVRASRQSPADLFGARSRSSISQAATLRLLFSSSHFFFAAIDPFCALYARLTRCISRGRVTGYANCKAVSALPATMRERGLRLCSRTIIPPPY